LGDHPELVALAVIVVMAATLLLAQRVRVPHPILLVVAGAALAFVPGMPDVALEPDVVLLGILPPLVFYAAFRSSVRELRENAREIAALAILLVVATTAALAALAHFAFGLDWALAAILGAILSPTDPVAATAVASRLGVPRRLVVIIEGESLVNDGTGLVLYGVAITAATTGAFSLASAGLSFVTGVLGGLAIGGAVAYGVGWLLRRVPDPPTAVVLGLACAYCAYLPAEWAGVSGIIAGVTAGAYLGWLSPRERQPGVRLSAAEFWRSIDLILEALVFVLIGLELPIVLAELPRASLGHYALDAAAVFAVLVAVRFAFLVLFARLPAAVARRLGRERAMPSGRGIVILGWAGMRGAVSLAAALAVPSGVEGRDVVLFLAYVAILATLLLEGLSLPWLIQRLDYRDEAQDREQELRARALAVEAALGRLEELADDDWVIPDSVARLRRRYEARQRALSALAEQDGEDAEDALSRVSAERRLELELLAAQRRAVLDRRDDGDISDEVLGRVLRDLDLSESRLAGQ
jgi:CPA1 family monovalent cation:H+ antiporter